MNLIDKARLIKDIQHTIKTVSNKMLPLIEQAKAAHHLKEILVTCKKNILQQKTELRKNTADDHQKLTIQLLRNSQFKASYRGLFQEKAYLLQSLAENPSQGWAILYDLSLQKWQIWLIPAPAKGAIYSSWKIDLNIAYEWLIQQNKLLNCFQYSTISEQEESLVQEAYTIVHLFDRESILTHLHMSPKLYRIDLMEGEDEKTNYIEWFTHTKNLQKIQTFPVILVEKLNTEGHFLGYMAILGIDDVLNLPSLLASYCKNYNVKVNTVKSVQLQELYPHLHSFDALFECFFQLKPILAADKQHEFIPKHLLSSINLVHISEATATAKTPVVILQEQQHYRIVHGQNRLALAKQESAVPYILLTRQHGMSWQKIQQVANTFLYPVTAEELTNALEKNKDVLQ